MIYSRTFMIPFLYITVSPTLGFKLELSHCRYHLLSRESCKHCEAGWWGPKCDVRCKGHCNSGCKQMTGFCHNCDAGYYTEGCTTPCPDNCYPSYQDKVFCNRTTGACLEGCRVGWWGDWCEKRCSTGCEGGICYQHDGKCIKSCNPGWSGAWCKVPCPALCALVPDGGKYCHWITRKCRDGCIDGWWGDHCQLECSSNCISKSCYHVNGSCTEGCRTGWTGDRCDVRCPSGCRDGTCDQDGKQRCSFGCQPGFHGHHCDKTCNIHCINRQCSHDHQLKSTVCANGCMEGWWSPSCMRKCPDICEACEWKTGRCFVEMEKRQTLPSKASMTLTPIHLYPLVILGNILSEQHCYTQWPIFHWRRDW